MEFTQNNNGNWVATTPLGSTLVVFRRKDDYGFAQEHEWSWVASTTTGKKRFSDITHWSAEDAMGDLTDELTIEGVEEC